jgi:hypothetical protein
MISMQFSQLKIAAFRFLSVLLSSTTYTELLVTPKDQKDSDKGQLSDELRDVLRSAMKLMTQCAVLSQPISKL